MKVVSGKAASELDEIFEKQSQAIKASPGLKFDRDVSYVLVECDTELKRIPLDAKSIGLAVKASPDDAGALDESFIFSLLLVTGTLNQCTIDVPSDSSVEPSLVLEEAEAQGLNVRLLLPERAESVEDVARYAEQLTTYSTLWLTMQSGTFSLAPLDGYLEYKFASALGHKPDQITSNPEMQALFTDTLSVEAMDFIKGQLDDVFERELGGDQYFLDQVSKVGAAIHLKQVELREARRAMLEQELDARTPVPNLIRATAQMTGLSIPDAAGMIYEIKNSIHTVLDKYLPKVEGEGDHDAGAAQVQFAENISSALAAAFGGKENLVAAWDSLSTRTQLKQTVDLDRGNAEPSDAAKRAATHLELSPKVAALAAAEFTGLIGTVLQAGKTIDKIGLERPVQIVEPSQSNIIAIG